MLEQRIEAVIETGTPELLAIAAAAIDLLDEVTGDADFEPCQAGDDGGRINDGWCGLGYMLDDAHGPVPEYGEDQSQPPINWCGTFHSLWGA